MPDTGRGAVNWLLPLLLLLIFAFFALTIRTGHRWGDDFALYIQHARNIADGEPYARTGYLYNPYFPQYSPRMYPPIFPLLLAPIYKIFGLSFTAMKVEQIVFFIAALAAVFVLCRDALPAPYSLLVVAIVGLNPVLWNMKDDVLSDLPFLCFLVLTLVLVTRRASPVLCGLTAYLAIGTRTAGLALLPAILAYELYTQRALTRYAVVLLLTALALLLAQDLVLRGDAATTYVGVLRPTPRTIASNVWNYAKAFTQFWAAPVRWVSVLACAALAVVIVVGARRQQLLYAAFAGVYLFMLVLYPPNQGTRFLVPVVPLAAFYAVSGMRRLGRAALVGCCALLATAYALQYRVQDWAAIPETTARPAWVDVCAYVRTHTSATDRLAFNRARALALFTDRSVAPIQRSQSPDALWAYWQMAGIDYVVVTSLFPTDVSLVAPLLRAHDRDAELTYANPEFSVYRLRR